MLTDFTIYRSDRLHEVDKNSNDGSVIAVKNDIKSHEIKNNLVNSCEACRVKTDCSKLNVCIFHKSPYNSN